MSLLLTEVFPLTMAQGLIRIPVLSPVLGETTVAGRTLGKCLGGGGVRSGVVREKVPLGPPMWTTVPVVEAFL